MTCSDYAYNYSLTKYMGIGNTKLNYQELLSQYVETNKHFIDCPKPVVYKTVSCFKQKFYFNDQAAFQDGIKYFQDYYLATDNSYGMPGGMAKKQIEYGA